MKYNKQFVDAKQYLKVKRSKLVKAHKKAIVVTCMDARLIRLLPHALNFHEGDAKVRKLHLAF
jgi:carbonic anhydrase